MINLLLGAPGGGKSYEAVVYHVIPALEKGRKVITNLPLNVEELEKTFPGCGALIALRPQETTVRPFSTVDWYGDPWRDPEKGFGPLYVIDECHMALPRGGTPRDVDEWFALHRHEGADVLLITQSYGKVSKAVIDLVQTVYRVRKNTIFGSSKTYTRKVQDGVRGEVMNTGMREYNKAYFRYYRSHTMNSGLKSEAEANDIVPIWKHWTVYGALACLLIVAFMLLSGKTKLNPMEVGKPAPGAKLTETTPVPKGAITKPVPVGGAASQMVNNAAEVVKDGIAKLIEPFQGFGLHLAGHTIWQGEEVWYFAVSQNGTKVSGTTSRDLKKAGYIFDAVAPCIGRLTWQDKSRWILCDSPKMVMVATGSEAQGHRAASDGPLVPQRSEERTARPDSALPPQSPSLPLSPAPAFASGVTVER